MPASPPANEAVSMDRQKAELSFSFVVEIISPSHTSRRAANGTVRRIIAEHGGNIDVGDNTPRGTRFTIELPC